MHIHYLFLSLIITLLFNSTISAKDLMDPVIVTATKVKTKDTKATYASEVYNREDIEKSGAVTIFDFLNNNTSTAILPNWGNPYEQNIDIRGFGFTEGFKNVAITVNGRRLNNIDSVPQKLIDIGINTIDRIEITKGSGSIVHGDGATGGSIQIYTRDVYDTMVEASVGNYGVNTGSFTTSLAEDNYILSFSGGHHQQGGFSDSGPDGNKDRGNFKNYSARLQYFPTESSELYIEKEYGHVNIRYPNGITQSNYENNPATNFKTTDGATNYTFETSNTNNINLGGSMELTPNLEISLDYAHQDKTIVNSTHKDYHSNAINTHLNFRRGPFELITGVQAWQGKRRNNDGTAAKTNTGVFVQTNYDAGENRYSVGGRRENVSYAFDGNAFQDNTGNHVLTAYDIGLNRTINDNLSMFSNFNYAFMSADIDRWFTWDGDFNGFISPSRTQTLNFGVNHVTPNNKLKVTIFGMKVKGEQFANPLTFTNTNIHKSHKYGFELQNKHNLSSVLSATLSYVFIQAIIDRIDPVEADGVNCANACEGKFLPGVSDHSVTLGINYTPTVRSRIVLSQNYRSESYALEDFSNDFTYRADPYTTTDISYRYKYKGDGSKSLVNWWQSGPSQAELILKIDNLFEQTNGIFLEDNVIYPTNFARRLSIGTKFTF